MNKDHISDNESNKKYLEIFEKNIESNISQEFKDLKANGNVWNGNMKYEALFDTWSKVIDEVNGKNKTICTKRSLFENSDFPISDVNVLDGKNNYSNNNFEAESITFIGEIDDVPIEIVDCENNPLNMDLLKDPLRKSNNSSSINLFSAANILNNNELQKNNKNNSLVINSDLSVDQGLIKINENLPNIEQNLDKCSTLNKLHLNKLINNLTNNVKEICTTQISNFK